MKKFALLALAAVLPAIPSQAAPSAYGMIGLTTGETLRINVADPDAANPTGLPPGPCRVELSFLDGSGNQLLPAVQFTLQAGQSTHYDLNGDKLALPSGVTAPVRRRMEVRPVVLVLPNATAGAGVAALPPGPCFSSIEVFDNATGKTLISSCPPSPPDKGLDQPAKTLTPPGPSDKIFGQLGIVSGQTIRLNAVNVLDPGTTALPPSPCRVSLVFFDESGTILAHATQVLQPGVATLLDFSLPKVAGSGGQAEVRADVSVDDVCPTAVLGTDLPPPDPCRATLEVFDNATGKTTAIQSPQAFQRLANPPGSG